MKFVDSLFLTILTCFISLNFTACSDDEESISKIEIVEGETLDVLVGDSKHLNVKCYPEHLTLPECTWESSNQSVVEIDRLSGQIKAKSEGESTITVTAIDLRLSASCQINVKPIKTTGIVLSEKTKELFIGEKFELTAIVTPENATYKELTWSSSDTKIATVDNKGQVSAISVGECVIYAKTKDGNNAECKVKVKAIDVEQVSFDAIEKTIEVNQEFTLTVTIAPQNATFQEIKWSSTDETVASVDDKGKVIGKKVGTCSIVAESHNGKKAECKVTVNPISVQLVQFTKSDIKLLEGETKAITFNVFPAEAKIEKVQWKILDESIASVTQDGKVTCKKIGNTILTVTVNDKYTAECNIIGCSIEDFITLRFGSSSIVSINGNITGTIGSHIVNSSSKDITAKSIQLIDSGTGQEGNIMDLSNATVEANSSIGYSITIRIPIYKPIFRWVYSYNNKDYIIESQFDPSL